MSKSKGNVVNPDDIVEAFGADTLRLYEMFMGPLDASTAWSEKGIEASRRFLDRVWRLVIDEEGNVRDRVTKVNRGELDKVYHQTIKKVTEDYEQLHFNTAISQMMIFVNEANKVDALPITYIEGFVQVLAPIAPHMTEEIWKKLGHTVSVTKAAWPIYDEKFLVEDEVEVVFQVNGKVKSRSSVPAAATKEELTEIAMADEKVKEAIAGKQVRKVIAVTGKLVNIVAN